MVVALLATSAMAVAIPATANANLTEGVEINMRTVNNGGVGVTAHYCPRGHVSISYKFGTRHDPCNRVTEIHHVHRNGGRFTYSSNPFGEIIRAEGYHPLYFYARNPSVGRPFIEVNGTTYRMVEGQLTTVHVAGATIRLHREGDRDSLKQMTIEVIHMGKA
jgi:hypothetical protein